MTPKPFPGANVTIGAGQSEYLPLPAYIRPDDPTGYTVTCWRLSWRERLLALITGRIWHGCLTFNEPFRPVLLTVAKPPME